MKLTSLSLLCAAALALLQSLLLATGGPGTGKTTTIARLLVLLIAQARLDGVAPPRIALAAPTGRAAERMAESLRLAAERLRELPGVDAELLAALPQQAGTLHRLLGVVPDRPRFRHDARNPLAFDVVVVDEASMVDLPLMCKLVEAVPDGARLILLGDRDQLPSVEAGDVLAAIVDAAGDDDGLPAAQARALRPLLGDAVPALAAPSALAASRVHLRRGYRQAESLQLAPLADEVPAPLRQLWLQALDLASDAVRERHDAQAEALRKRVAELEQREALLERKLKRLRRARADGASE